MRNFTKKEQKKYTESISKVYEPTGYNILKTDNTETLENALARIEELEKENAKAKEIIKGVLPYITLTFDKETNSYLIKYLEQAEDFIKE